MLPVPKPTRSVDERYRAWIGKLPCLLCHGYFPPNSAWHPKEWEKVEVCHVKTRGSGGGDWLPTGEGNLWPGCHRHNQQHGELGTVEVQRRFGISLPAAAELYGREYRRMLNATAFAEEDA